MPRATIGSSYDVQINWNSDPNLSIFGLLRQIFTEEEQELYVYRSVTFERLSVYVIANTINAGTTTFQFRDSGADGNQSVVVGAGLTGWFRDTSNTDSLTTGDRANVYVSTAGAASGIITVGHISVDIYEETDYYSYIGSRPLINALQPEPFTYYWNPVGELNGGTTENLRKHTVPCSLTWAKLGIYISDNDMAGNTTVGSRINGINGNQSFTVPAKDTGYFYETDAVSDSLGAGDEIDVVIVTPPTGGNKFIYFENIQGEFSGNYFVLNYGGSNDLLSADTYFPPFGRFWVAPEAQVKFRFPHPGYTYLVENCHIWIDTNTTNTAQPFKSRVNGADGNISISIPAGTTGQFQDTSNKDEVPGDVAAGDFNWMLDWAGGTGSLVVESIWAAVRKLGDDSEELFAKFSVQVGLQSGSADLLAIFEVCRGCEDLLAKFEVRHPSSAELYARAEVRHPSSAELLAKAEIRQSDSEELYARFEVGQGSAELLARFEVCRGCEDLLAKFEVRHPSSTDLYARAEVRHPASTELLNKFEVAQSSFAELLGRIDIRQSSSAELLAKADIQHSSSAELLGKLKIAQSSSAELLAKTEIRNISSAKLLAKAEIRQSSSAELLGKFIIGRASSVELLANAEIRHPASVDLLANAEVRQPASAELLAKFEIQDSEDLLANAEIRQPASAELLGKFVISKSSSVEFLANAEVRQPGFSELLAKADIRNIGSAELLGKFTVGLLSSSAELYARAEIRNISSAELLAKAEIRHPGFSELLGKLEIAQSSSAELLVNAEIRQPGSSELLAKAEIRNIGSAELLGKFEIQDSEDLLAKAEIRQASSAELLAKFTIGLQSSSAELLAKAEIRQPASAELLAKAEIRHPGSAELLGKLGVAQSSSAELLGRIDIRQPSSAELLANAVIRHPASTELLARFIIRREGEGDLLARFIIAQSDLKQLLANLIIRKSGSEELYARFEVGQGSADLLGKFEIQNSAALFAKFDVRQADSAELSASICVHTNPLAQDLNQWTEYDSAAFLTHDCNEVNWSDLPRAATDTSLTKILLKSRGSNIFDRLHANLYDVEETPNGATERVILWAGHDAIISKDFYGQNDNEIVALILHATSIADQYQLELREKGGNSAFMVTTWPTLQSRYIQIYKEGAYIRATVWQSANYDQGALDDWCEITLSGDLDFNYTSIAMSYGQAGAETSTGYINDVVLGSFDKLYAKFEVRQPASAELLCKFTVGLADSSTELLAKADVRQASSTELLAKADIRHQDSAELLANANIRQAAFAELLTNTVIRQSTSTELLNKFEVTRASSAELLANAEIRQSLSAELLGKADIRQPASAELLANAEIRQFSSAELLAKGVIRHDGTPVELLAKGVIRHDGTPVELLANADIRKSASVELLANAEIRHDAFVELLSRCVIRHDGTPTELLSKFVVSKSSSIELLANAEIRQSLSEDLPARFELSTIEFSLREHKVYGAWNPDWQFSKPAASELRGNSPTADRLGYAWVFFTVNRKYIHGKYLRIRWRADYTMATWPTQVQIWDGAYDRSSDVDFPTGSQIPNKGNGQLQILLAHAGDFAWVTEEGQIDVSGGSQEEVTIFIWSGDAWSANTGYFEVDFVEINSAAAGSGRLFYEPFNAGITMERTGTTGDYGYISDGELPSADDQELLCKAEIRQPGSADLLARFEVGQDSQELLANAEIRHPASAELFAKILLTEPAFADLLARFEVNQDSQELLARFEVGQGSVELLAYALITRSASAELLVNADIRHPASAELSAKFEIQDSEDLFCRALVTRVGTQELLAKFIARHSDYLDLLNRVYIRPKESTAVELGFGGRDRRLIMGGTDRELIVGGRDRRMRIK